LKQSIRKAILTLVGTSLGVYMMVAPLAVNASANPTVNQPNQTQTVDQKQQSASKHDKIGQDQLTKRAKASHDRHKNDKNSQKSPVEVVKSCASELGFNVRNDTFTLVSQNQNTAVVQVLHDGNSYDVTLTKSNNGAWVVLSVE